MTQEQSTSFTLRLDVHVQLADGWRLRRFSDVGLAAVQTGFSENFPPVPWTTPELLHDIREELMGTVAGSPFLITGIERVEG